MRMFSSSSGRHEAPGQMVSSRGWTGRGCRSSRVGRVGRCWAGPGGAGPGWAVLGPGWAVLGRAGQDESVGAGWSGRGELGEADVEGGPDLRPFGGEDREHGRVAQATLLAGDPRR